MSGISNISAGLVRTMAFILVIGTLDTTSLALAQKTSSKAAEASSTSASFQQLSSRAQAALDADKVDEALPLLHKALTLNPNWVEGWWSLGTALYDQDRYAEAALAFQKVVTHDPKHGTAHALLGLCQFEMGDEANSLRNIEAARDLGTSVDPQLRNVVLYHEGVLLQRSGRFIGAQAAFSSLCLGRTIDDNLVRAFGMAALQIRDKDFAAPATEAGQVEETVGRAACLVAQKDFDSAHREFAHAIEQFPHFPYVHYAYGRDLVDEHDIDGAVAQFKAELDLGHDRVLPLLQIAAAEYKNDSAAGLPFAEEAVKRAPQMPFAHFLFGLLLMNTGDYEKAVPELEIASKGLPHEAKVFWSLGSAYEHVGRTQDAVRARAEFVRLSQKASVENTSQDVPIDVAAGPASAPEN